MSDIELAERYSQKWTVALYVLAAAMLLAEVVGTGVMRSDFVDGVWLGIALVCACALLPWRRWLRPSAPLNRLLDDEGVREHRRLSCAAGFWVALIASLILAPLAHDGIVGAYDVARIVATAALAAAMVSFATLELRAGR